MAGRHKRSLDAARQAIARRTGSARNGLVPPDLALPGARLHPLRGGRAGQWSVSISGNWRVIFEFEGQDVTNVDLVDYH